MVYIGLEPQVSHGEGTRFIRLLVLGDSVRTTTGFATVIRQCLWHFHKVAQWDIWQIGSQDIDAGVTDDYYKPPDIGALTRLIHANRYDQMGFGELEQVVADYKPHVVLIIADAVTVIDWLNQLAAVHYEGPTVAYIPVEGAPVSVHMIDAYQRPDRVFTCTQWGARVLQGWGLNVPVLPHGVDPSEFHPLSTPMRALIRESMGWRDNEHVVAYVARNGARKSHDALLMGFKLAREHRPDLDLRLYLHCRPYARNELLGWDLAEIATSLGIQDAVQFPTDLKTAVNGLKNLGAILASANQYVHPAFAEGFGLPIVEAMACGLPVAVTRDQGNMSEVGGAGVARWMEPVNSRIWHTGAFVHDVNPATIAASIIHNATLSPEEYTAVVQRGYEQAAKFRWEPTGIALARACRKAAQSRGNTDLIFDDGDEAEAED